MRYLQLVVWSAAALVVMGCSGAGDASSAGDGSAGGNASYGAGTDESEASGTAGASTGGINGTLLFEQKMGPDHTLHFYDFGDGTTGVRESLSMDSKEAPALDQSSPHASLSDVYKRLNPSTKDVPPAIIAADLRAAQARELARAEGKPTTHAVDATELGGTSSAKTLANHALTSAGDGECSIDFRNDTFGGPWFLQTFCNAGSRRVCEHNFAQAFSGEMRSSWFSWRQMEGDYTGRGHILGTKIACHWWGTCDPRTVIIDYDVLPRAIEIWNFNDGRDYIGITGTSRCGHLHFAALRS